MDFRISYLRSFGSRSGGSLGILRYRGNLLLRPNFRKPRTELPSLWCQRLAKESRVKPWDSKRGIPRVRESSTSPHSPLTRIRKRSLRIFCTNVHGKVPIEMIGKSDVVEHATDAIEGGHAIIHSCPDHADAVERLAKCRDVQGLREEVSLVDLRVGFLQVVVVGAENFM